MVYDNTKRRFKALTVKHAMVGFAIAAVFSWSTATVCFIAQTQLRHPTEWSDNALTHTGAIVMGVAIAGLIWGAIFGLVALLCAGHEYNW